MKLKIVLSFVLSSALMLCSCSSMVNSGTSTPESTTQSTTNAPSSGTYSAPNDVFEKVANMTIDEKIGQIIITGFSGYEVDDTLKSLIQDYHVGGTILFSRNVKTAQQVVDLNNQIKKTSGDGIPLFVTMDEEGGEVTRLPDEVLTLPSAYTLASTGSKDLCYKAGKQLGTQIKALGFCTGNSPDLDIWSNPVNTVIGDRAYGTDTASVLEYGIAAMNGIRDGGAIPVAKHFPGHGDTSIDSHYGLPIVDKSKEELNKMEFVPFKEAIKEGVPAIMVTHILLNSVDNQYPASLSQTVVNGILRTELGFQGVCFSDDMTMGAITETYTLEKACILAFNAGIDSLLICHEYENTVNVITALKEALANGTITEKRLDEAVTRILTLKHDYSIVSDQTTTPNIDALNTVTQNIIDKTNQ